MSMIVVTGGAGFIGSNIVKSLNRCGNVNILVVDDLSDGKKFANIVDCEILDYLDKDEFLAAICADRKLAEKIAVIFHQGACTGTAEWNGRYMLKNNFEYSKHLLHYCLGRRIPFIYASSAAIYGRNRDFREHSENETPLNVYGYSKLLFDQHVRRLMPNAKSQVVGLRYFNVYGPNEQHKGAMASVIYHFQQQLEKGSKIKLFVGSQGFANGEQRRDFIYVSDIAEVNLWFWRHSEKRGIYNVGTGISQSFNAVAQEVIAHHGRGGIEYIPFPQNLLSFYQSFTEADVSSLRAIGYERSFKTIKQGIKEYLDFLKSYDKR